MRTAFSRDFYIPKGATKIDGPADSCAYVYETAGVVYALGFNGKRNKPDWHHRFKDDAQRQAHIQAHFKSREESLARKAEWRAEMGAAKCHTVLDVWNKAQSGKGITAPDAAICLRAQLKAKWPTVKFSVRSDRCLDVYWTDGPSAEEVNKVAHNYAFEGFDGMIDMRYQITRWLSRDGSMSLAHDTGTTGSAGMCSEDVGDPHAGDAVEVRHGPDFVFVHRTISFPVKLSLTERVCKMFGIVTPEQFPNETALERFLNTTRHEDEYLCTLVYRASTGALQVA